jgi:hypothetical protein
VAEKMLLGEINLRDLLYDKMKMVNDNQYNFGKCKENERYLPSPQSDNYKVTYFLLCYV